MRNILKLNQSNYEGYTEWLGNISLLHSDYDRNPFPALLPFAWDEVMCARAKETDGALLHIWRHPSAFIVGLRDRRLPKASEAMAWLRNKGYDTAVRNSGGAAVPLDSGVVNLSLVLPHRKGTVNFHNDFAAMAGLIGATLTEWTSSVEDGEVQGSYCPGDYDLAIGGRKFCGIAQRRQANGFVIQAFIVVEGEGTTRADLARQFYNRASGGDSKLSYPSVTLDRTASLQELAGVPSAETYITAVKRLVLKGGGKELGEEQGGMASPEVERAMQALADRYDK